jgi:hypothetical protein
MNDMDPAAQRTAICLAGHAVGCLLEGLEFNLLSLGHSDGAEPFIEVEEPKFPESTSKWSDADQFRAEATIRALLSGLAAMEKFGFGACSSQLDLANDAVLADSALWRAVSIAGSMQSQISVLSHLWRQVSTTTNRRGVWLAITSVHQALCELSELDGRDAQDIALRAMRGDLIHFGAHIRGLAPQPRSCAPDSIV